ncbi:MAG: uroporphyrinogen-III synthase [Alphaproteobacteria bacterium]|nr:uroporphyrinogen-III synthase [Alphaproteobacteria bacterium]
MLITRTQPDADQLSAKLHALGHTTIIEPLLDIVIHTGAPLDLRGVQALVFTSANGARAAATRTVERALPCIAVGPATAVAARELDFSSVTESLGEGVEGLVEFIKATRTPGHGALLHPAGTVTAGDMKASLERLGYVVRKEILYEARAAETLSGALTTELGAGLVTSAMFFSPRTATLFATLAGNAGLAPDCRAIDALALSPAVAKALAPLTFKQILIAAKPTTDAILELVAPG